MRAQAKEESPLGLPRQIPSNLRRNHRAARKRPRRLRAQMNRAGLLGGDRQREKGIMRGFADPGRAKAQILRLLNQRGIPAQVAGGHNCHIEFHVQVSLCLSALTTHNRKPTP